MNQQSVRPARGGWREEETALLLSRVRQAEQEGRPLRQAFLQTAEALGRRPNSIRNYYYASLGEQLASARRKPAFELFSPAEVEELVRQVLLARGRGESVRACVTRLAEGDPKRMLRLQNKYRSVLKSRPELIRRLTEELRLAGEPCPVAASPLHRLGQLAEEVELKCERLGEPLLPVLLSSLDRLLARAAAQPSAAAAEHAQERLMAARRECDRLKVERDLLKMALEDARPLLPAPEALPDPAPLPAPPPEPLPDAGPMA